MKNIIQGKSEVEHDKMCSLNHVQGGPPAEFPAQTRRCNSCRVGVNVPVILSFDQYIFPPLLLNRPQVQLTV